MAAVSERHDPILAKAFQTPSKFLLGDVNASEFHDKYKVVIECFKNMEIQSLMREIAQSTTKESAISALMDQTVSSIKKSFESVTPEKGREEAFRLLFNKYASSFEYPVDDIKMAKYRISIKLGKTVRRFLIAAKETQTEEPHKSIMEEFAKYPSLTLRVCAVYQNAVARRKDNDEKFSNLMKEICPEANLNYTYWYQSANLDVESQMKVVDSDCDFEKKFNISVQTLHHFLLKQQSTDKALDEDQVKQIKQIFIKSLDNCSDSSKKERIQDLINNHFDYLLEKCKEFTQTLAKYNCTSSWLRSFTPF